MFPSCRKIHVQIEMKPHYRHISVLQKEVVDYAPLSTQTILDCTLEEADTAIAFWENTRKPVCMA
ncbi:MAG: hypothetical protein CM1200mP28_10400 [Deltaproteobacteria bacterium]|nr:MAG: hypothetical protein CM1200mP28_10400 [Deltaproteobacteria bacterium]